MNTFKNQSKENIHKIISILKKNYPYAKTDLLHSNPFQLLIATILSAQCTDIRVNMVTPELFQKYPDAHALSKADQKQLESLIRPTGFYKNKAKSIVSCSKNIVQKHGGQVPKSMEKLTVLGGVGRKTANVILGNAFGVPSIVVDTHVKRLSYRIGFSENTDPEKIEYDLMNIIQKNQWVLLSHLFIYHGRRTCTARNFKCRICCIKEICLKNGLDKV